MMYAIYGDDLLWERVDEAIEVTHATHVSCVDQSMVIDSVPVVFAIKIALLRTTRNKKKTLEHGL
jgi:hypothetical protein